MSTEVATVEDAPAISLDDARALTDQIKANADHLWQLLADAYTSRAWAALGHASWDDYCQAEFGDTRLQLPREKRKETVQSLRSSGLTIAAISSATGASTSQVSRDAENTEPPVSQEGKRKPGRPKGSKNKPKADTNGKAKPDSSDVAPLDAPAPEGIDGPTGTIIDGILSTEEYISVPVLPDADPAEFKETEGAVAAFGSPEVGAVACGGAVMVYHSGYEVDTFQPEQARTLAAALLQAADRAEA